MALSSTLLTFDSRSAPPKSPVINDRFSLDETIAAVKFWMISTCMLKWSTILSNASEKCSLRQGVSDNQIVGCIMCEKQGIICDDEVVRSSEWFSTNPYSPISPRFEPFNGVF